MDDGVSDRPLTADGDGDGDGRRAGVCGRCDGEAEATEAGGAWTDADAARRTGCCSSGTRDAWPTDPGGGAAAAAASSSSDRGGERCGGAAAP